MAAAAPPSAAVWCWAGSLASRQGNGVRHQQCAIERRCSGRWAPCWCRLALGPSRRRRRRRRRPSGRAAPAGMRGRWSGLQARGWGEDAEQQWMSYVKYKATYPGDFFRCASLVDVCTCSSTAARPTQAAAAGGGPIQAAGAVEPGCCTCTLTFPHKQCTAARSPRAARRPTECRLVAPSGACPTPSKCVDPSRQALLGLVWAEGGLRGAAEEQAKYQGSRRPE